jgi:agmatine/peptidylarginine deiminase
LSVEITEYRNAISLSEDNSLMEVEINHPDYGWIPYGISSADTDQTIDNTALLALIGSDFIASTQEARDARLASEQRTVRDNMLQLEVDSIVSNPLRWAALTTEKQNEWAQYRTDLLNVPQQSGFPNSISWPTKPE